jgi:hypothetical protein
VNLQLEMGSSKDEVHAIESRAGQRKTYQGPERRTRPARADEVEPVVLTRKFAEVINDIDLTENAVGDRLPLAAEQARLLIAEGWACRVPAELRRHSKPSKRQR